MRTRTILALIAVLCTLCTLPVRQTFAEEKIELRILYVGSLQSAREKDFVDFLQKHFKEVKTGDLKSFREEQTRGSDVTILDYAGDAFKAPRLQISNNYSRATVTVGVMGAFICSNLRLKSGYL
jgi:hypothetical protein